VLIPTTNNADSVSDYRPIANANFKFKIILKILANRLSKIMPAITFVQQRGSSKEEALKITFVSLQKLLIFFIRILLEATWL